MNIIGLYGRQGVGKSYIAHHISTQSLVKTSAVRSFATPVKHMASVIEAFMTLHLDKNEPCPEFGFSKRQLYQVIGTEVGRHLNPDVWLMAMQKQHAVLKNRCKYLLIDDVRFDNEANWIRENDGVLVKIESPLGVTDKHASEVDWKLWEPDMVYYNHRDSDESIDGFVESIMAIKHWS